MKSIIINISKRFSGYFIFCSIHLLSIFNSSVLFAQEIIPLYTGAAPGSENWTWQEKETRKTPRNFRSLYDVTVPTLTVFAADSPNGSAVLICPGGGFQVINIDHEGYEIAKALNKKGITAFVFKYRVVHSLTDDPYEEVREHMKDSAKNLLRIDEVKKMAIADAGHAMNYIRKHAAVYKIDPALVGIMGFSGGGAIVIGLSLSDKPELRPDFSSVIYGTYKSVEKKSDPNALPPLFIACASDDMLSPPVHSVNLYRAWINSGNNAELHIYSKGGHGLWMNPVHNWLDEYMKWLHVQGILKSQ